MCGLWSVRFMLYLIPDCQEHLKSDSTSNDYFWLLPKSGFWIINPKIFTVIPSHRILNVFPHYVLNSLVSHMFVPTNQEYLWALKYVTRTFHRSKIGVWIIFAVPMWMKWNWGFRPSLMASWWLPNICNHGRWQKYKPNNDACSQFKHLLNSILLS